MRSLIFLVTGLVAGIAATLFITNSTDTTDNKQQSVTTSVSAPKAKTPSPFDPVSDAHAPAKAPAQPVVVTTNTTMNTPKPDATLPDTGVTDVKHYRDVIAYLQYIDQADSSEFERLLQTLPVSNHYDSPYAAVLHTAIYQRWAELDIDEALTYATEKMNDRDGAYQHYSMQGISLLAASDPDYVREWIKDNAQDTPGLIDAVYSGLATNDPEAFVREFISTMDTSGAGFRNGHGYGEGFGAIHSAMMQWAEQDPQAALEFIDTQVDSRIFDDIGMRENILYTWFEQDPTAASTEIEALLNDPNTTTDTRMMLADLHISQLAKTDPEGALQWAMAQDNPMLKENAVMNIIYSWDHDNITGLQSFIDQLPADQRDRVLPMAAPMIANSMARTDPAAAMAWAEQLPEGQKQAAMSGVIGEWAYKDPDATIEWLSSLPNIPENQGLIIEAAGSIIHNDPEQAVQLFERMPQTLQTDLVEPLIYTLAQRGPDSARQWLSQQSNPEVLQMGSIVLDTLDPNTDTTTTLDNVAGLQTNRREEIMFNTIMERAMTDHATVLQWIQSTPLIAEEERTSLLEIVGDYGGYGGGYSGGFGGAYFPRRYSE